ncbi:protein phosphatase 2C 1-like [Oppia nitens]|uniref:protein phosphatase 2C 1-like n=1 Tax=Oppia nitens TaxID=1686743 RepID=UPI0023D9CD72|nr:protein phosphatase 2C 1-like [Oppia nitens]
MGETYLKQCISRPESEDGKGPNISYGASSVQGWRSTQEDAHICLPKFDKNASLWAVFDGHNGAEVAQLASKLLPNMLLKNKNYKEGKYESALQEAFQQFDDQLLQDDTMNQLIKMRKQYSQVPIDRKNAPAVASGCTAIVVLIKDGIAYAANLGDSRCILSRNGRSYPLSSDHKPENTDEKNRIENAGGQVICGRINGGVNVSRAFGDHHYKHNTELSKKEQMIIALPDIKTEQLTSNDNLMVLICDGIWNSVANEELIGYVNKRIPRVKRLSKICEEVFKQILPTTAMPIHGIAGKDNMTFLIVKFEPNLINTNQVQKPNTTTNTAIKRTNSKESVVFVQPGGQPRQSTNFQGSQFQGNQK